MNDSRAKPGHLKLTKTTIVSALSHLKQIRDIAGVKVHLPTALADQSCEALVAVARTKDAAFDLGLAAGYMHAVCEVFDLDAELLVTTLLRPEGMRNSYELLARAAEMALEFTSFLAIDEQ